MSPKTNDEVKDALIVLVSPWLPDATVEEFDVQERCGCYSEWTQEPPSFNVTFRATHDDEVKLSKIVSAIEPLVTRWAKDTYDFTGGQCCQGEDYEDGDEVEPHVWVRVIPIKPKVAKAEAHADPR